MQEDDAYFQEEYKINLMDLFWYIFRQWRAILVAMIVLGIMLGGYGGLKEFINYQDKELVQKAQKAYETTLQAYEADKARLESRIERLGNDLEQQKFYEENCLILQIDPYNVYIHSASYYIDTNYEIAPDLFYQNPNYTGVITNSYKSAIDRIDFDAVVATEDQPLLTVKNPTTTGKKMITTSTDEGNGILNITVFAETQERADMLFSVITEVLQEQETLLNTVIGEHTLGTLLEQSYVDVDSDFSSLQDSFHNKTSTIDNGILKAREDLKKLEEPVDETPSIKSIIKQTIKLGIIGLAIGLVLVALYYLVLAVLDDRFISASAFESRFGVPCLGSYNSSSKHITKLDVYLEKKLGILSSQTKEEQIRYIVSSIKLYRKEMTNTKIVLVGTAPCAQVQELKERLQKEIPESTIIASGNATKTAEAVEDLLTSGCVIGVEVWQHSQGGEIQKVRQLVQASGNRQLGFVAIR